MDTIKNEVINATMEEDLNLGGIDINVFDKIQTKIEKAELQQLERPTATGDASAQYQLEVLYREDGDYMKTSQYFFPAVKSGNPTVKPNLTLLFCYGKRVPIDGGKAKTLLELAAQKRYVVSQYELDNMYKRNNRLGFSD
jgi:TPR repeat protein